VINIDMCTIVVIPSKYDLFSSW